MSVEIKRVNINELSQKEADIKERYPYFSMNINRSVNGGTRLTDEQALNLKKLMVYIKKHGESMLVTSTKYDDVYFLEDNNEYVICQNQGTSGGRINTNCLGVLNSILKSGDREQFDVLFKCIFLFTRSIINAGFFIENISLANFHIVVDKEEHNTTYDLIIDRKKYNVDLGVNYRFILILNGSKYVPFARVRRGGNKVEEVREAYDNFISELNVIGLNIPLREGSALTHFKTHFL